MTDLIDPVLDTTFKGFPHGSPPLRRSEIGAQGWRVTAGDLPLPVAVLRASALAHNIGWMQAFAESGGVGFAPHGKTTMSPQLLRRQLDAGAWGLTFANVTQLQAGLAAGARHLLIANQVFDAADLAAIAALRAARPGTRVLFLLDSEAQLALIESTSPDAPFEVLLELGIPGVRTGCRTHEEAIALARRAGASAAVTLAGIECYEGMNIVGDDTDVARVSELFDRVDRVARQCAQEGLFGADEVVVSAGGSAVFDLVVPRLRPALGRPVLGLLRSGCYVTHDQGQYRRYMGVLNRRIGCADSEGLRSAIEVWAAVQSLPEPGLALLTAGKRDVSYDLGLPVPLAVCPRASHALRPAPTGWAISALNDQHAYLRLDGASAGAPALAVGDRVVLGISHPCTTFDKWRWMPIVDDDYRVVDAITTVF
jgi:D-serine dehydratase